MKNIKRYNQLFENNQELTQEQKDWLDRCTKGSWSVGLNGLVYINGDFDCSYMGLEDFKGVRFGRVNLNFNCSNNKLESLEGAPERVIGNFNCASNLLKSLEYSPKSVGGSFNCSNNDLTSLKGAPERINRSLNCAKNKLTSFKDAPQQIAGDLYCFDNKISSLDGIPKKVSGELYATSNPISEKSIEKVLNKLRVEVRHLERAVAEVWEDLPEEDQAYLAKHNPDLTDEEKRIYRAMELNMKRR